MSDNKIRSDIRDLYIEKWLRNRNKGHLVWITKDGKEIPIKDMTDEHIENAIVSFERHEEHMSIINDNLDVLGW